MRFSRVWKRALQNPALREVTVTFPQPLPPALSTDQVVPTFINTDGTSQLSTLLLPDEANNYALRYIVQWMEGGGVDSDEQTALPCPKARPGLQRVLALAQLLQVRELIERMISELTATPVRPKKCEICKRFE